ncbi:hypothetical protein [Cupriavidus sp. D384]|nr:hypothetical protein [Cupriavidus sp. D384]
MSDPAPARPGTELAGKSGIGWKKQKAGSIAASGLSVSGGA